MTLFNIFLERILSDAVEDHEGKVSMGSRTSCITSMQFTNDIDALTEEEHELEALLESLNKHASVDILKTRTNFTYIFSSAVFRRKH